MPADPALEAFLTRWINASGGELANYGLFLTELCAALDLPPPEPASEDTRDNAYVFQRRVVFSHGDGEESLGFVDLYRRGAFVLEAKKLRKTGKAFDDAMLRARSQAEQYARALPAAEGRPPFLVVLDVGNAIELYAEFSRSGATYTPFPDPRSHRFKLEALRQPEVRERLRQVWLDPLGLDPSRRAARVTREIAAQLAVIARALETAGHAPVLVAGFLTRALFSMFAEDVGLLPKRSFVELLESLKDNPAQFVPLVGELWKAMDEGTFSVAIRKEVLKFNGKLFHDAQVLPLNRDQIALLLEAARFNWRDVEPAIFGTLLERALVPSERHKLGAHYTPRAYVERLVLPTVIEPLREDWSDAQAAALLLASEGKLDEAREAVHAFHNRLCEVRVLDPACGSGNFLYVTLEHLKRLEGEVFNQLSAFGEAQERFETQGNTVDPHQLLGIELNPRAAAIAELVLWIGYLQWHFRTRGNAIPPQPVLRDFQNVEHRDAVLAYDRVEFVTDERGVPVTRWDGRTFKKHPVTGQDVPDETGQTPLERYVNPRKAEWPRADFVVGNPPFIGAGPMRAALGDGYVEALRGTWKEVPESADLVMYWWNKAAALARFGSIRRFGLITTNSMRQTFNRRVVERHLTAKPPLSLTFAIPDHPWVDSADGAAVRIAMSVAQAGDLKGRLLTVEKENDGGEDGTDVELRETRGKLHADLRNGANVAAAVPLKSNADISSPGVKLHGAGFIVTPEQARALGLGTIASLKNHIRLYRNGKDLTNRPRGVMVIDLFGLSADDVRRQFPDVYQWLLEHVKPQRDAKRHSKDGAGYARLWWLHGKPRTELRPVLLGLKRYIATAETAKHRTFQFLDATVLPDNMLIAIATDKAHWLGVLSSEAHVAWTLATGGTLEDRPRYNKTRCFETFPFPTANPAQHARIGDLAEQLDAHRKRQQSLHTDLTLTGMYNVLEKLKAGEALNAKDKAIHEHGLVSVLKQLHDELDLAVLDAYGWSDLAPLMQVANGNAAPGSNGMPATHEDATRAMDEALLERLVALNAERAAEEAEGTIRWLRPEFQEARAGESAKPTPKQGSLVPEEEEAPAVAQIGRMQWPKDLPEQLRGVAEVLARSRKPIDEDAIAARFTGRGSWKKRLPLLIETLVTLGRARKVRGGYVSGT